MNLPDLIPYAPEDLEAVLLNRVQRGAAFLDQSFPGSGWRQMIDPVLLDISSNCRCIRGQLREGPLAARMAEVIHDYAEDDPEPDENPDPLGRWAEYPYSLGLEAPGQATAHGPADDEYEMLDEFWRQAITRTGNFA